MTFEQIEAVSDNNILLLLYFLYNFFDFIIVYFQQRKVDRIESMTLQQIEAVSDNN
jgi:hypothetical protein